MCLILQTPLVVSKTRLAVIQSLLFCAIAGEQLDADEQHHAQGMVSYAMTVSELGAVLD